MRKKAGGVGGGGTQLLTACLNPYAMIPPRVCMRTSSRLEYSDAKYIRCPSKEIKNRRKNTEQNTNHT